MSPRPTVKTSTIVGVIASVGDLRAATRTKHAPDIFELRLDALISCLDETQRFAAKTRRPLIITARHPAEGGMNKLNAAARRHLLERFLSYADYVDIELRSLTSLKEIAKRANRLIVSVHDFRRTPSVAQMNKWLRSANVHGAEIFKIATRTDEPDQLCGLLQFASSDSRLPVVAMGVGKLGSVSRLVLAGLGSPFIYAAVGKPIVSGQMTVAQVRTALGGCPPARSSRAKPRDPVA